MRKRKIVGGRLGGVLRLPPLYIAFVPLAIPFILASVTVESSLTSTSRLAPPLLPPIRYSLLAELPVKPLPAHSSYVSVEQGDTLDAILRSGGLSAQQASAVTLEFGRSIDLKRLRTGELIRFDYSSEGSVEAVEVKVRGWGTVHAKCSSPVVEVTPHEAVQTEVERTIHGTIESSLYEAVRAAGASPQVVQGLIDIFQWDVDFFALRRGDEFSFVVTEKFSGDDPVGFGAIKAAKFEHDGTNYEAFRYVAPGGAAGYYTSRGAPVRKQFLKAPLKFTRVTSGFSKKRFHPVLGKFRPHWGIDYGAPAGTPVMSTADGVVLFAGYDRGEGNYIRIKHNSRIQTSYLHLSRFARGIKKGTRVEQGTVIGYVGMTGLATGPHLDYRVSDSGRWLNPLQLRSITPDPLHGVYLRRFLADVTRSQSALQQPQTSVASMAERPRALF